ncbi:hypothetical protein AUEXF2481DRAFT_430333 [Aureobasidium subglaciale EXF-2481]|uniref:Uncharacterized protein n=1 Tax=Aureobasidium subglaciale (strain EXF-2481) TaxID=1043005 RepID=A0A074YZR8_AURSE|nr:uncharacterized protein AUEXF2481DRAFT_430333 [Aureobasidium subglaciale EXF-2481]KEQ92391.1 hypothetical protein AUEXF2481DRAFT_430333 [Aureobasidium subglaciale EXF-2481]
MGPVCESCGLVRYGGTLYWQSKALPDHYSCRGCYVRRLEPEGYMPKGFEDVQSWKELVARKEQLDKLKSQGSDLVKPRYLAHQHLHRMNSPSSSQATQTCPSSCSMKLISLIVLLTTSSWGLRCVHPAPALEPVSSSPAEAYRCKCPPLRVNSDASVRFLSWLSSLPASHCILPPLS